MFSTRTVYTVNPAEAKVSYVTIVAPLHVLPLLTSRLLQVEEPLVLELIFYLSQYCHLLCSLCRRVVLFKTLYSHLNHHYHINQSFYQTLITKYKHFPAFQTDENITLLVVSYPSTS
jgi:hypothetical protein